MIRLYIDPTTKLVHFAKRNHLCKKTDNFVKKFVPQFRIYWDELKKPYVPQAESVSYVTPEGNKIKMDFDIVENFFTHFHDTIKILELVIEFEKPLGIRSIGQFFKFHHYNFWDSNIIKFLPPSLY